MSNIILFGAGASYGAGEVVPDRPPLGSQLYSSLATNFPRSWGDLPSNAADEFKGNFEKGMQVIWDKYSGMTMELMRHMALYFAQFRPKQHGSTVYSTLAEELKKHKLEDQVTLVTINYECLLEFGFSHAGIQISYSLEETKENQTRVLKPHGSCNFLPRGISGPLGSIKMGRGGMIDMPVQAIGDMNEVIKHILTQALPPVMCLYMKGKPTQVANGTVKAIQKQLQDEIAGADSVVIVGVKPNTEDTHLWDFIASCPGRVGYVGPSDEEFKIWEKKYRPEAKNVILADGFYDGIDSIVDFIGGRD